MRCLACGAEMFLINVIEDSTVPVSGFEQHTFRCSECHDVKQRLVFTRHGREDNIVPVQEGQIAAPRVFSRMVARIRSRKAEPERSA